jgi:hypothetical protein
MPARALAEAVRTRAQSLGKPGALGAAGRDREEDDGKERRRRCHDERRNIERHGIEPRDARRTGRLQRHNNPPCEQQTESGPAAGENRSLREPQPVDPPGPGAERRANRRLSLARHGAR